MLCCTSTQEGLSVRSSAQLQPVKLFVLYSRLQIVSGGKTNFRHYASCNPTPRLWKPKPTQNDKVFLLAAPPLLPASVAVPLLLPLSSTSEDRSKCLGCCASWSPSGAGVAGRSPALPLLPTGLPLLALSELARAAHSPRPGGWRGW